MTDKLLHFLAGSTIAAFVLPFGPALAAAAVLVAGIGRELVRPPFDARDLMATIAGGAAMLGWLSWM